MLTEKDQKQPVKDFYKITVDAVMPSNLYKYFSAMDIEIIMDKCGAKHTVLVGKVKDQAELIGILNMLYDLNYTIQSVE